MNLETIQKNLNLQFKNLELLKTALTHCSYRVDKKRPNWGDNERLEFLGDAVLKLIVSDFLFKRFPKSNEGDLTKIRAKIVSDKNLFVIAQKLNLGDYILFSQGEKQTGGSEKQSNLANAFEALLGAYYWDQGLESVQHFLHLILEEQFDSLIQMESLEDYKTKLQEMLQRQHLLLPTYTITRLIGPEHDCTFEVEAEIEWQGKTIKYLGSGRSKKNAEQAAAKGILDQLIRLKKLNKGK